MPKKSQINEYSDSYEIITKTKFMVITLFNHVGWFHDLAIGQLYSACPSNKPGIFVYYSYIQAELANLGGVRTCLHMDHQVVSRLCKIYDWLLNSSRDHFSLYQMKISYRPWRLRSPKDIFQGSHGPTGFAVGEAKKCYG